MSVFQVGLPTVEDVIAQKIIGSTAVDIVDATDAPWSVPWLTVSENASPASTPALTVELYDGTNSYYLGSGGSLWKAKALTNGQTVTFDLGYLVPLGWKLRVTSGDAAGKMEVSGIKTRRLG